jgi:hypothetical protein
MKLGTYLNSATQARFGQAMGRAGAAMCLGARQKSTMERKARWMAALERHDARFGEVRPATGRESVGSLMEVMRDTAPLLAEFNAREAAKDQRLRDTVLNTMVHSCKSDGCCKRTGRCKDGYPYACTA